MSKYEVLVSFRLERHACTEADAIAYAVNDMRYTDATSVSVVANVIDEPRCSVPLPPVAELVAAEPTADFTPYTASEDIPF